MTIILPRQKARGFGHHFHSSAEFSTDLGGCGIRAGSFFHSAATHLVSGL
jgi:hypothetical protein